jgi:uncharacterized membrane protein YidH (DUF202 family)
MGMPPPLPPPPGPGGKKRRTAGGGYPLIGLALGMGLAMVLPGVLFGVSVSTLEPSLGTGTALLIGLGVAIVIPAALTWLILSRLDRSDPQQESIRVAALAGVIASVALYAVLGLLIGACVAILVSAY